jgi:hypothetical protein
MKLKTLTLVAFSYVLMFGVSILNYPGLTEQERFFCGQREYENEIVPATIARTETGNEIPVIYWISSASLFNESPVSNCDQVSHKFQQYFDNDLLKYIRTGLFNEVEVICVARQTGGECSESDILIMLPPNVNRFDALGILLDLRRRAAGRPLYLTNQLITYKQQEAYISIDVFLQTISDE